MKTHWFSVLSVAGIVFLTGNALGSEVRWAKLAVSGSVEPSVMHIPTIISEDAMPHPTGPVISHVQHLQPVQLPQQIAIPTDLNYLETMPLDHPVPPGAALQSTPLVSPSATQRTLPIVPNATPTTAGRGMVTTCGDQIGLKSIREISHDIRPPRADVLPEECAIDRPVYYERHFGQTCFMWKASALSTRAAYFEDVQLERYGNTIVCPALQPIVSGAKFFATIPILPYKMGVTPPNECVYTLGHRRPGNRSPYMVKPFPISPRGAAFQAGVVAGGIAVIP